MNKKTVYIDMDGVIVNFQTGIDRLSAEVRAQFPNDKNIDEAEGIFGLMDPFEGAVEAVVKLANSDKLDVFILSTAPWRNPSACSDKLAWIQDHFGEDEDSPLYKRVILSHRKDLNQGDFLIDDRKKNECGYILSGKLLVRFDNGKGKLIKKILKTGQAFHFPPGSVHQEQALTDCTIIEASTPHFNDRVRVEKKYGIVDKDGMPSTKKSEIIYK